MAVFYSFLSQLLHLELTEDRLQPWGLNQSSLTACNQPWALKLDYKHDPNHSWTRCVCILCLYIYSASCAILQRSTCITSSQENKHKCDQHQKELGWSNGQDLVQVNSYHRNEGQFSRFYQSLSLFWKVCFDFLQLYSRSYFQIFEGTHQKSSYCLHYRQSRSGTLLDCAVLSQRSRSMSDEVEQTCHI